MHPSSHSTPIHAIHAVSREAATRRSEHTFSRPHTHSCRPSHRVRLQHNIGHFFPAASCPDVAQTDTSLPLMPFMHQSTTGSRPHRQLRDCLSHSPTVPPNPPSTAHLFEIDAREMALGIFAAQNNRLKRDTRLPSDQVAGRDFTPSRAGPFKLLARLRGFFHRQSDLDTSAYNRVFVLLEPWTTASALMPNPCSLDTDFTRNVRRLHTGTLRRGG